MVEKLQDKKFEVIIQTHEVYTKAVDAVDESQAVNKALDLLDEDIDLKNRAVSYSVMDVIEK